MARHFVEVKKLPCFPIFWHSSFATASTVEYYDLAFVTRWWLHIVEHIAYLNIEIACSSVWWHRHTSFWSISFVIVTGFSTHPPTLALMHINTDSLGLLQRHNDIYVELFLNLKTASNLLKTQEQYFCKFLSPSHMHLVSSTFIVHLCYMLFSCAQMIL